MINLEEHKYFDYEKKTEVVPYDLALQALEELKKELGTKVESDLDKALKLVSDSMEQINNTVKDSLNND